MPFASWALATMFAPESATAFGARVEPDVYWRMTGRVPSPLWTGAIRGASTASSASTSMTERPAIPPDVSAASILPVSPSEHRIAAGVQSRMI